eukprot:15471939-Alexandrium_andersonii.AAC.1
MPGGPVMQSRAQGNPSRQQALVMAMWPQAGRGTSHLPPRALFHHSMEEPVSVQVLAQASAAVE